MSESNYRTSRSVRRSTGFNGYIGYSRKLFYIKLSQFVNNKPSRVQTFNIFKDMVNLAVLVVSYGDCQESPYDEIEIYIDFDVNTEPIHVIDTVNNLNIDCKKEFIKCDNSKCKLIHISRQDTDLVYQGVDHDSFSEQYHKLKYLRECFISKHCELNYNHMYISQHKPNLSALCKAFKQYIENNTIKIEHFLILNKYKGWQREVVKWYNEFILNAGSDQQIKQLFLWGKSGYGKSSFIYHILGRRFCRQIFRPLTSDDSKKYQWESFSPKLYNLVIVDEFDFKNVTLSLWKQACEGREFKTLVRYDPEGTYVQCTLPFIMISNYAPLDTLDSVVEHDPVLKRLYVVKVDNCDENGRQSVEYIANKDSEQGLTLDQIKKLPDDQKTTLTLSRKRNEAKQEAGLILNESNQKQTESTQQIEQEQLNLTIQNVSKHNQINQQSQQDSISNNQENSTNLNLNDDSAFSSVSESVSESVSKLSKQQSLDETINIASQLSIEVLKELLKRKQSNSDLNVNSIKRACIQNQRFENSEATSSHTCRDVDSNSDNGTKEESNLNKTSLNIEDEDDDQHEDCDEDKQDEILSTDEIEKLLVDEIKENSRK